MLEARRCRKNVYVLLADLIGIKKGTLRPKSSSSPDPLSRLHAVLHYDTLSWLRLSTPG